MPLAAARSLLIPAAVMLHLCGGWVLGLLLVLFLLGYSLIAALFPRRDDPDGTRADCA